MANKAREIISPDDPEILVRVVILHVGQGNSAVVLFADGDSYKSMLIDVNLDQRAEGIDVPRLMSDLLGDGSLDIFVNTHPHNDHLCGILELDEAVQISEVWHSGHVPGPEDRDAYDNLQKVIKHVKENGGDEVELDGSKTPYAIGEAQCYILAPAEHVKEEIAGEKPEVRRQRIHEHCAVLRVGLGDTWIMLPGDADLQAWRDHISEYHKDRLPSCVFAAPHHSSRSFFMDKEGDEPYLDALQGINPEYVIVSAPRQDESRHGHPHDDAMELYEDQVGQENVLHTGKDRHCYICDIFRNGEYGVEADGGELVAAYKYDPDGGDGGKEAKKGPNILARPRADVREPRPFA